MSSSLKPNCSAANGNVSGRLTVTRTSTASDICAAKSFRSSSTSSAWRWETTEMVMRGVDIAERRDSVSAAPPGVVKERILSGTGGLWIRVALAVLILFPLFLQLQGTIYHNPKSPLYDSGGDLRTLPLPLSLLASMAGLPPFMLLKAANPPPTLVSPL